MSEMRSVIAGEEKIDYILTRKKMRNMRMRITSKCEVTVSCPLSALITDVEKFVIKNIDWIKQSINKILQNATSLNNYEYMTGEKFLYLGKEYQLMVREGQKREVKEMGDFIFMTVRDLWDFEDKRALLDKWYKSQANKIFADRFSYLKFLHKDLFADNYQLKIKKAVSTWGTCAVNKGIVTLNFRLIYAPIELIDSVILHELCHFYYIHHDKDFYGLLATLDPLYKEHSKALDRKYIDYTHWQD
ncbi:MAG: M48 family metallopeptidase [Clostridia bacterium]|nr:M48 family metallopeptidase [Clostridia bacterium]